MNNIDTVCCGGPHHGLMLGLPRGKFEGTVEVPSPHGPTDPDGGTVYTLKRYQDYTVAVYDDLVSETEIAEAILTSGLTPQWRNR